MLNFHMYSIFDFYSYNFPALWSFGVSLNSTLDFLFHNVSFYGWYLKIECR